MRFDPPFSAPRVRFQIEVDGVDKRVYLGEANNLLFRVRAVCRTAGIPVFAMTKVLPGGIVVTAARFGEQDVVSIQPVSKKGVPPKRKQIPRPAASFRGIPVSHTYPGGRVLVDGSETSFDTSGEWENYPNLRPPAELSLWKFRDEQPGSVTWWSPSVSLNGGSIVLSWRGPSGRYGRFQDPTLANGSKEDGATTIFGPNFVYTGRRGYPAGGWNDAYFAASYNTDYRAAFVWLNGWPVALSGIAGDGVVESAALQRRAHPETGASELFLRVFASLRVYEVKLLVGSPQGLEFFSVLPTTVAMTQIASLGAVTLKQCPFFNESATKLAYMTSDGFFTFDIATQASSHIDIEGSTFSSESTMQGPTISSGSYSYSSSGQTVERGVWPLAIDFDGDNVVTASLVYNRTTDTTANGSGVISEVNFVSQGSLTTTYETMATTKVVITGLADILIGESSARSDSERAMVINTPETGQSSGTGLSAGAVDDNGTQVMLYGDLRVKTFGVLHVRTDTETVSSAAGVIIGSAKTQSVTGTKALAVDLFVRGSKVGVVKAEWDVSSSTSSTITEEEWGANVVDWDQQPSVSPGTPQYTDRGQLQPQVWGGASADLGPLFCPVSAMYVASSPPGIPGTFDYIGININAKPDATVLTTNYSSFFRNGSPIETPDYGVGDRQLIAEPLFMGVSVAEVIQLPA